MGKDINGNILPRGIYQTPKGFYRGQFQYRKKRYCVSDKDLMLCIKKYQKLRYEVENDIYTTYKKITVDKWYKIWFEDYKRPSVKRSTATLYEEIYNKNIKPMIGGYYLEEVTGRMIQNLYKGLYEQKFAGNSIEVCRAVMNGMFEQAFKEEMIKSNPVKKATIPKARETEEKIIMSQEQQKIFVRYAEKSRLKDLILLAIYTGMRSGEIRGLQWDDVDFNNELIYVNHTLVYNNGQYYLDSPKTKSSKREIPMITEAKELLLSVKSKQLNKREKQESDWSTYDQFNNLVFTSPSGMPISASMVKNKLDTILDRIRKDYPDFPMTTFHCLRHLFATRCVEAGMPFNVLQKILGHSKLAQTMDLYAHVLTDTKVSEMKKVENILSSKTEL